MAADPTSIEQAVSRALRDNLERLQRTSEELHQALADLVAACASSRPSNALPPMLRAQTAAASLAAALEVLSRFITAAMQPAERAPGEREILRLVGAEPAEHSPPPSPRIPTPMGQSGSALPVEVGEPEETAPLADQTMAAADGERVSAGKAGENPAPGLFAEMAAQAEEASAEEVEEEQGAEGEGVQVFDLAGLSSEEQEMHRRANRVAKVSMQDIKMLRPEQVRLGRENKDLCVRLRDDLEKAHKEYDRRFRSILDHPVDYFYHWMVEILANGDPDALGEYPYPSPVLRR